MAGGGIVVTFSAVANEQRALSAIAGTGVLAALLLGALQITFCSGSRKPLPATEQERADISGKNRPTGLSCGPAADPEPEGP